MRKIFLTFLTILFCSFNVFAENFPNIKYKTIKLKDNISYNESNGTWSYSVNKKNGSYYTKVKGFGNTFDYNDSSKNFAFTTGCEYEFIYNGNLIGYSNKDLKFYEITYINGGISKRALKKDEVQNFLPNYTIISLSEFNPHTNAYKMKKNFGELNLLIYNDSEQSYDGYYFSSGNSKLKTYDLSGFVTISKSGMIQFSANRTAVDKTPCYVLLIR